MNPAEIHRQDQIGAFMRTTAAALIEYEDELRKRGLTEPEIDRRVRRMEVMLVLREEPA